MAKYSLLTFVELVLSNILAVVLVTDGRCTTNWDLRHLGPFDVHNYMHVLEDIGFDQMAHRMYPLSDDIPEEFINISIRHVEGSIACPEEQNNQSQSQQRNNALSQGHLHDLAVCPFRYVQNKDCNRKPEKLYEVECLCPHRTLGQAHIVCRSVRRHVYVFRRTTDENGEFRYRGVLEPLTVACMSLVIPPSPHPGHHQRGVMSTK